MYYGIMGYHDTLNTIGTIKTVVVGLSTYLLLTLFILLL